jgi:hypothetical protein
MIPDVHPVSRFSDLGTGFLPIPDPDPEVKQALVPDMTPQHSSKPKNFN